MLQGVAAVEGPLEDETELVWLLASRLGCAVVVIVAVVAISWLCARER